MCVSAAYMCAYECGCVRICIGVCVSIGSVCASTCGEQYQKNCQKSYGDFQILIANKMKRKGFSDADEVFSPMKIIGQ